MGINVWGTVHISWLNVTTQYISEKSIGITTSLLLDRFTCAEVNYAISTCSVLCSFMLYVLFCFDHHDNYLNVTLVNNIHEFFYRGSSRGVPPT